MKLIYHDVVWIIASLIVNTIDWVTDVLLACHQNGGSDQEEEGELVVQREDEIVNVHCVDLERCFERQKDVQHFRDFDQPTRTRFN